MTENSKAFGCSRWKEGCHFTLWKDALVKGRGPLLNERIVRLLLASGSVAGSTGVVALKDRELSFTPTGEGQPSVSVSAEYVKNIRKA